MSGPPVEYDDLLGRPFRYGGRGDGPIDCGGLAEIINVRAGRCEHGQLAWPSKHGMAALRGGELHAFIKAVAEQFLYVGEDPTSASWVGDFALSDPALCGFATHVTVLAHPQRRTWLTATENGGVLVVPQRSIVNCRGIYRVRRQP